MNRPTLIARAPHTAVAATHPQHDSCWSRYSEWCCSDNRADRFTSRSRRGGREAFFYSFDSKQAAVRNKHQLPAAHWIPSATFPLVRPTHRHRLPVPPCPGRSVPLGSLNTQSFLNDSYLTRFLTCTVVYTFVHTHKKLMLFCILTPSAYFIQHKIHNNNISKLLCYSKQLKKRLKTLWFVYGCGAYWLLLFCAVYKYSYLLT